MFYTHHTFSHVINLLCHCYVCIVGSVHSGPTIQTIQGASLPPVSSQPAPLVSTPFTAEDEQHTQPISQQSLHYLHSAYRVGELSHLLICYSYIKGMLC